VRNAWGFCLNLTQASSFEVHFSFEPVLLKVRAGEFQVGRPFPYGSRKKADDTGFTVCIHQKGNRRFFGGGLIGKAFYTLI
jgi:hypothetical protein